MPEGGSRTSTVPVFWATFGIFRRDPNDFLSRLVTMDETWLYHYDPETNNNHLNGGIAAHPTPKISECKNPLEKFSPWVFGIKKASFSLIIFQRAKLSTRSITYLCWCNWRTFWRKNAAGSLPRRSCSCTTMPRLTRQLQPRRNWPTWASIFLITHPILRIWPRRTKTCSPDWKKQLIVRHFSSDAEVIAVAETCLDGQLSDFFFWVACKSWSNGLRSILSFVRITLSKSRVWSL